MRRHLYELRVEATEDFDQITLRRHDLVDVLIGNYSGRLRSNRQEWEAAEGEAEVFEYRQAVFA